MSAHASLGVVKLTGKVKNGKVAVKLPEGTPVTVEVVHREYPIDARGRLVITAEQEERELQVGLAEADAGLGMPAEQFLAELRAETRAFLRAKRRTKTRSRPQRR